MTGQQVALLVTILLTAGLAVWAISHLVTIYVEWQAHRRRASRFEAPQRMALAVEDPAEEDHDWDGFLRDLTRHVVADEYEPRLAEQAIEIPREGETSV